MSDCKLLISRINKLRINTTEASVKPKFSSIGFEKPYSADYEG